MKYIYRNTFPVCFLSKSSLLIFRKGNFSVLDLETDLISESIPFKTKFLDLIIFRIKLISRILRKGVRCGIKISDSIVLFVSGQRIFELNLVNKTISHGFITDDNSRPLCFSKIEGLKGIKDGVYFGGYKGNPDKKPISVFRRSATDFWEEVYKFPQGTIEHIHNIIPDPINNVVYILTGDFDNSAGIWITIDGFKNVVPLLTGDQKFRGCVGFPTPKGLLYATDSPFSQNSIRLLTLKDDKWESMHISDINGPSIYGCQWNGNYVFSTSVEGGGRNQSLKYKLFGLKRGSGVKTNYSVAYIGNIDDGFKEFYKEKKDLLPFYFFQFGVLIFASGINESSYLPVYPIATSQNSMNTILLKKIKIHT